MELLDSDTEFNYADSFGDTPLIKFYLYCSQKYPLLAQKVIKLLITCVTTCDHKIAF